CLNPLNDGELLSYEASQLPYILPFRNNSQIEATRHEPDALHFGVTINFFGHSVKTDVTSRGNLYINEGEQVVGPGLFPVDNGFVSFDDALFFKIGYALTYLAFTQARERGNICNRCSGILCENTEYFVTLIWQHFRISLASERAFAVPSPLEGANLG